MASVLSPRLLLRGFLIFIGISVLGYAGVLLYGNNLAAFLEALAPAGIRISLAEGEKKRQDLRVK